MIKKLTLSLLVALACLALNSSYIFAADVVNADPAPASGQQEGDTLWLWGEVSNIDVPNKTLTVKYLDYDTDQEKEATLVVDDKTVFENVAGLSEIQPKDEVSVDHLLIGQQDIAKNVSVEKADTVKQEAPQAEGAITETAPAEAAPQSAP